MDIPVLPLPEGMVLLPGVLFVKLTATF